MSCGNGDSSYYKYILIDAIWDNKCPQYADMIAQIKPLMEEEEKNKIELPVEPYTGPDTLGPVTLRW